MDSSSPVADPTQLAIRLVVPLTVQQVVQLVVQLGGEHGCVQKYLKSWYSR